MHGDHEDMATFNTKLRTFGEQKERTGVLKGLLIAGMIACLAVIIGLLPDVLQELNNH